MADTTMTTLELVKAKLGIMSNGRDVYLERLIDAVKSEWENHQGMRALDYTRIDVMDLLADYVAYRYARHEQGPMPRHLEYRLRSLWIKEAGRSKDG